uniref:WD repeat-containing protein 34 n=2 Tax=Cacopsylla melanoneura TaxID=428564 RepID=A0A8D8V8Y5_9HEMI
MSKFKDHENEAVGFETKWKENRTYQSSDSQTEPIKRKDEGTQPVVTSSSEAQTSSQIPSQLASLSPDEEQSLAKFLSNISNNVMKELDKNDASNAMARLVMMDFEDVDSVQSEKVRTFEAPKIDNKQIKVSCVSWNCTGSLLAVGFCSEQHNAWCSHAGLINFYNTEKSSPSRSITTKSCVTSLSLHPYELSLVAAGMYSGEVCTYNLNQDDVDCLMKSSSVHTSPISQVSWEYTVSASNRPHLVVSSLDGTLSLYSVSLQTNSMSVVKKYVMSDSSLPTRPGILSFSFSPLLNTTFITSVEGGHLYSCSTLTATIEPSTPLEPPGETLYNPIVEKFEKHGSNVLACSFSKHSSAKESLFVTACLEEIRIYTLSSTSPVHTIFVSSCLGLSWSVTQPQVLFYWGADQTVIVYNVLRREQITSLNMSTSKDQMITAMGVNMKLPNLLATGTNQGETSIWQMPKYFKL